jgi:hypothetical protein
MIRINNHVFLLYNVEINTFFDKIIDHVEVLFVEYLNSKYLNHNILLTGICIPLFFSILIEFNYILEKINASFTFIFNLETFATIFLIFFSSTLIAIFSNVNIKKSALNGILIGGISGILVISFITIVTALIEPNFQTNQLLDWNFEIYLIISLIIQTITGAIGGVIGYSISKPNPNS